MAWIFDSNTYDADVLRETNDAIRVAAPTHQTYQYTEYYDVPLAQHGFHILCPILDTLMPSFNWRNRGTGTKQTIE
jgi:hypothetical protein